MIIYISGPMTGMPYLNIDTFGRAANMLRRVFPDSTLLNPHDFNHQRKKLQYLNSEERWQYLLKNDIIKLRSATHIYFLSGWTKSRGARREAQFARRHGIKVIRLPMMKKLWRV